MGRPARAPSPSGSLRSVQDLSGSLNEKLRAERTQTGQPPPPPLPPGMAPPSGRASSGSGEIRMSGSGAARPPPLGGQTPTAGRGAPGAPPSPSPGGARGPAPPSPAGSA